MKHFLFIILLLTQITIVSYGQGGKAEPNEIKFKKGSNSIKITGNIKKSEEAEYTFEAKKNQVVKILLDSIPANKVIIKIMDSDSEDIKMKLDGENQYSFKLLKDGEYFISISNK